MKLKVRVRPGAGSEYDAEFSSTAVAIGRRPDSNISFQGDASGIVSWDHARIELKEEAAFLTDCGSTNGTYLNGRKVEQRTILKPRDKIVLGKQGPEIRIVEFVTAQTANPTGAAPVSGPDSPHRPASVHAALQAQPSVRALDPPASSAANGRSTNATWIIAGAALAAAMMLGGVLLLLSRDHVARNEPPPIPIADKGDVTQEPQPAPKPRPPGGEAIKPKPKVAPPVYAPQELAERHTGKVVWIGFRASDAMFPYCTGWVVRPRLVATTASSLDALFAAQADGRPLVVSADADGQRCVEVTEMHKHSEFNAADTAADTSVLHNVGVAVLAQSLEAVCDVAAPGDRPPLAGATLTALGFAVPRGADGNLAPLDDQHRPSIQALTIRARGAGGSEGYLLTDCPSIPFGMDGAPLIRNDGKVIALLGLYGKQIRAISVTHLDEVIKALE